MHSDHTLDPKSFDQSIKPADDFFAFVNATWIKENPIPPEESHWGSFYVLRADVEKQLKEILDGLDQKEDSALSDNAKKVKRFYRSAMDVENLNKLGDAPLRELFASVESINNVDDLSRVLGRFHRQGVSAWWASSPEPDAKNSDLTALYFSQSGLSLPDRDYYLKDDEKSKEIRANYLKYIGDISKVADPAIKTIMDIETRLAGVSMTRVELRDIEKQYNKMSVAELAALTPGLNWKVYCDEAGIVMPEYVIVCQPKFMEEVSRMWHEISIADIKVYLRWHVLNSMASYLSEDLEKRSFDFYGKTFSGVTEMKPRWRRALGVMNHLLDEAVGELYVEKHFSKTAKAKIEALVERLIAAYRVRINALDWMGEETKKKALIKLEAVSRKLGYPDMWKDITGLRVDGDSYAANYMSAYKFEFDRQMKKVGKPVDRKEWYMSPQTVNACYSPLMNEILFPAAILQPPFFDPDADDAVNFGGIGTVIGHELTHGFDDQGALFSPKGNLENWWTKEDKERFDKKTAHLAEQFDKYEPLPGVHVNGKLTLGENIADLGAMYIARDGLELALKETGKSDAIDGLTPYQRFFINYAITERGSYREEALRFRIQTDPHSPSEYRVNGPVSNMVDFYEAFECKPENKLWREPDDRVKIW